MAHTPRIYLATTNPGKLRELREAALNYSVQLEMLPGIKDLPAPVEDGATFEANARLKAEYYSRHAPGDLLLAEDSGLSVDMLKGAPGVYSARYAAILRDGTTTHHNSSDEENNRALIEKVEHLRAERGLPGNPAAKYVCVMALARNGTTLQVFSGEARGELLTTARGTGGFGYDPLFYFPALGKTFAELSLEQKREHSHRGQAFRRLLEALPKITDK